MTSAPAPAPLGAAEFAASMVWFEPFEPQPHLAVAVSGGADSLALTLLAAEWARARGGRVSALTVDHGLRTGSAEEAARLGRWLAERGIAHRILTREAAVLAARPAGGVQAAARALRYRLLEEWCAAADVLHLLVAHHRDDQAETVLLRLARGSGLDGLAGMAEVTERAWCRVLRPLLAVPRDRLRATLEERGQAWIDDPSNRNRAYARVRLRHAMAGDGLPPGLLTARLAATAARLGRARRALEAQVAAVLARAAMIHPAGFIRLDPAALLAAPPEIGLRALAAMIATVGGGDHGPRLERLERVFHILGQGLNGGVTLGGCCLVPRRGGVLVCREAAALEPPVPATPGCPVHWDGRYYLKLPKEAPQGMMLGGLGAAAPAAALAKLPAVARAGVPALHDDKAVVAVPAVGYVRDGVDASWLVPESLRLRPLRPWTGAGFKVV